MEINTNFLIIGMGLLGGSIAKKLKSINYNNIFALSHREETVKMAKNLNLVKYSSTDLKDVLTKIIPGHDILIIMSTPPDLVYKNFLDIMKNLDNRDENIIITDISSVKSGIYEKIEKYNFNKNVSFVGSHPMAGKETSGLINSEENLLDDSIVFITPIEKNLYDINYKKNILFLCNFWKKLNTKPIIIKSEIHDEIVALTSHFQHILSAIDIKLTSLQKNQNINNILPFAIGGSFNSNTRIAKSDPRLWTDIIFKNRKNILLLLKQYKILLQSFENLLIKNEKEKILNFLESTQKFKISIENKINEIKNS